MANWDNVCPECKNGRHKECSWKYDCECFMNGHSGPGKDKK